MTARQQHEDHDNQEHGNEEQPTQTGELGILPEPTVEPGETNPGGVDALPQANEMIAADLDPDKNPAVDQTPDPLKQAVSGGEDTATQATQSQDGSHEDLDPQDDSPA